MDATERFAKATAAAGRRAPRARRQATPVGDELARHRQWACDLAETFSGTEILPLLLQLSLDLDGHVRKAASRAALTLSSGE